MTGYTKLVDCSHAGLTEVPRDIRSDVRTLHLNGNNITSFKRTDFNTFAHLESLYLGDNPTKEIEKYPFSMLLNLKHLEIQVPHINNYILHSMEKLESLKIYGDIKTTLDKNLFATFGASLQYVGIHTTGIKNLDGVNFSNLVMLKELNFTGNKIEHFDSAKKGISKLQSLDLSNNKMTSLSLSGLHRLTYLNAENNNINQLDLRELSVLTNINLSKNKIYNFSYTFPNMETLDLSINKITEFQLPNCHALKELDISDNPLDTFKTFNRCSLNKLKLRKTKVKQLNLRQLNARLLDLSYNCQLKSLNLSETYQDLAMRDIDMSHSCLKSVHPLFLKGNHVNRLKLQNNNITHISNKSLVIDITVSHLDLSNNHISRIKFAGPSALYDYIDLSVNDLALIESGSHVTIQELNLASNALKENDLSLKQIDMVKLNLSRNHFKEINFQLMFGTKFVFDMEELDLSFNRIEELKYENLKGLQHIASLYLDHNHIQKIEASSFQHMFRLSHLTLEANQLQQVPFTMREMKHLNYFSLKNNKITDIKADFFNNMNVKQYPTIDLSKNLLQCKCDWITAFQSAYNVHFSIHVVGNCLHKHHKYEIDTLAHYETSDLFDVFQCKHCAIHHCNYRGDCTINNTQTSSKFNCSCYPGYKGHVCESAESLCYGGRCRVCNDTYCENGGRCTEGLNSPALCRCRIGYEGKKCENDINMNGNYCEKCMNNSTCTFHPETTDHHEIKEDEHHMEELPHFAGGFCECKHGYTGIYCDVEQFISCDSKQHCSGHGQCMMGVASRLKFCSCAKDWEGSSCQQLLSSQKTGLSHSDVAVIVLALLLVLALVSLIYIVRKHHMCFSRVRAEDQYALEDDF